MKKYQKIIATFVCISCIGTLTGNCEFSLTPSNIQNAYAMEVSDPSIAHFEAASSKEFLEWMRNSNEKEEAFNDFIVYWSGAKNYLVPDFIDGKLKKIFADSNQNSISYLFEEPSVRVTYECIDSTNENDDIFSYMEQHYNVEYDKMIDTNLYDDPLSYNNGYGYNKYIYTKETLVMNNYTADCVCKTSYSEKSNTSYNIAFIYNNMLVRLIGYTEPETNLNKDIFRKLNLVCVDGSPLLADPPAEEPVEKPTETPMVTPSAKPTVTPSEKPTITPTISPSVNPTPIPNTATDETDNKAKAEQHTIKKLKKQRILVPKIKSYKTNLLKKSKVVFRLNAASTGKCKLSYKNTTIKRLKKYIKVSDTGVITLKKGAKKGVYKITISAAKTTKYKSAERTIKIRVIY